MATQKPISTISYNTEPFLKEKLDAWVRSHIIQAYQYIKHKGEGGDKDHIHLRIEPNRRLDQMDLSEQLKEWRIGDNKPLGVRTWRASKEDDWILYAIHDKDYLKVKYGDEPKEKLPYKWQDIVASDGFDVETAFIRARSAASRTPANVAHRLQSGDRVLKLIAEGANPFAVTAVLKALQATEYEQVSSFNRDLQARLDRIYNALLKRGLYWDDDKQDIVDCPRD